jgi:hypothetical protein
LPRPAAASPAGRSSATWISTPFNQFTMHPFKFWRQNQSTDQPLVLASPRRGLRLSTLPHRCMGHAACRPRSAVWRQAAFARKAKGPEPVSPQSLPREISINSSFPMR